MPDFLNVEQILPKFGSKDLPDDPQKHWLDLGYYELEAGGLAETVAEDLELYLFLGDKPVDCVLELDGVRHELTMVPDQFMVITPNSRVKGSWSESFPSLRITIKQDAGRRFIEDQVGIPLIGGSLSESVTFTCPELAKIAKSMCDSLVSIELASDVIFDGLARVFLAVLIRNFAKRTDAVAVSGKQIGPAEYRKLLDYVRENLSDKILVEDLAGLLAMSPSHFSRAFKASTRRSPMEFVTRVRVNRAHDMLLNTKTPLSSIAYQCGFSDQAHFTKTFKAQAKMLPSDVRKTRVPAAA